MGMGAEMGNNGRKQKGERERFKSVTVPTFIVLTNC